MNKKIEKTFNTGEIFINIVNMNNFISFENIIEFNKLLYLIITNISFNEFLFLLNKIKTDDNLNRNILIIEIIIKNIYLNLNRILKNYKNNNIELIKNELDGIFDIIIDKNRYNNLIDTNNQNINDNKFRMLLFELLSILLQLNSQYSFYGGNNDYFQKLIYFIKDTKIQDTKLILGIFKTLFFELYENDKDFKNNMIEEPNIQRLKYIEKEINLNLYIPKKMDNYLYNYFINIINFIFEFDANVDIVKDLLDYFEKLCQLYYSQINIGDKNSSYILCNVIHIFNSKLIMIKFFKYLNLIISKNKDEKLNIYPVVHFMFFRFQNPLYFLIIKNILYDSNNFNDCNIFLNYIIDIISKGNDTMNNTDSNKDFYFNSIELLNIFYLAIEGNKNLLANNNFQEIFIKYFEFLKRNKMLLSKQIIKINSNENHNYGQKTILEICTFIFISILINKTNEENLLKKYFFTDTNKSLLYIFDSLNKNLSYNKKDINASIYLNDNFNKYLKNNGNKEEEEKSILIIIINKLVEYKIKNINYNAETLDKYLKYFIEELLDFFKYCGEWKKISKDKIYETEIKLLKEIKFSNYNDIVQKLIEFKTKKEKEKINEKEKVKIEAEDINNINTKNKNITENENNKFIEECPFKKNCLLLKNDNISMKGKNIINDLNNKEIKGEIFGDFMDIDSDYNILCLKRDLLLKQCSIYFSDIYFNDKNFSKIKKYFKCKIENKYIKIHYELKNKLNYPTKLKNFSNYKYAYPNIFYKPYTSFYNVDTFKISHPYFHKESIKKSSFPLFLSHYYTLNSILYENENDLFKENCEAIMKTNIICGNIFLKEKLFIFLNDNTIKNEYGKNTKYLFGSINEDIKNINKLIIIKYKDIKEIINRRYIYDFRAIEIFLKNGKSYFFNLYSKQNVLNFFDVMEKKIKIQNKLYDFEIIKDPKAYFHQKNYSHVWKNDKISTFQYLLYINKFSSRSFNDINQYPIFPWIFLNTPEDINDKNTPKFRDMSFPISIKDEKDIEDLKLFFEANYQDNPRYPFHYRLHYSTSGYLLNYLVRVSPYTEEQIRFQGGQFDNPNRQLQYLEEILDILSQSHDNRELIPEFFITIDFFLNLNYIFFGRRLSDNQIINDICAPKKYFNSLSQYIYYNRLMINQKVDLKEKNKIKITLWIDLIFGYFQWDKKPNNDNLNLFGKYCYNQNINFDRILEKYKNKNYDDETKIKKINSKKSRIINFGQCPEVLFIDKIPEENCILPIENKVEDDLDIIESTSSILIEFKNKEIISFWISENNNYIYFLVENEDKINNQSILIYDINMQNQKEPLYTINIKEIALFRPKIKVKLPKMSKTSSQLNQANINNSIINININDKKERNVSESSAYFNEGNKFLRTKGKKGTKQNSDDDIKELIEEKAKTDKKDKKEILNEKEYYYYKISPKYSIFDICLSNIMYIFVGRNMDNSIKIYEQIILTNNKSEFKYNIFTDSFVSCLCKKDKNLFFSGHKNGKLYEWKIIYPENIENDRKSKHRKKNNIFSINTFECERDIFAHKESMICTIDYIEKHNIIVTSSMDGNLYIRKYIDFELLSIIKMQNENSIITKVIFTDYDLLYLLISQKDKDSFNNSFIQIYTLNGLLIESSQKKNFVDIAPLKNGKIISNNLFSSKLYIFGFNDNSGEIEIEDILKNIKKEINKKPIQNYKIDNFIFQQNTSSFYLLLDIGILYKIFNNDFKSLMKGVHKFQNNKNNKMIIQNKIYSSKNTTSYSINSNDNNDIKELKKSSTKNSDKDFSQLNKKK